MGFMMLKLNKDSGKEPEVESSRMCMKTDEKSQRYNEVKGGGTFLSLGVGPLFFDRVV